MALFLISAPQLMCGVVESRFRPTRAMVRRVEVMRRIIRVGCFVFLTCANRRETCAISYAFRATGFSSRAIWFCSCALFSGSCAIVFGSCAIVFSVCAILHAWFSVFVALYAVFRSAHSAPEPFCAVLRALSCTQRESPRVAVSAPR